MGLLRNPLGRKGQIQHLLMVWSACNIQNETLAPHVVALAASSESSESALEETRRPGVVKESAAAWLHEAIETAVLAYSGCLLPIGEKRDNLGRDVMTVNWPAYCQHGFLVRRKWHDRAVQERPLWSNTLWLRPPSLLPPHEGYR